jgi:hypothetical protein
MGMRHGKRNLLLYGIPVAEVVVDTPMANVWVSVVFHDNAPKSFEICQEEGKVCWEVKLVLWWLQSTRRKRMWLKKRNHKGNQVWRTLNTFI